MRFRIWIFKRRMLVLILFSLFVTVFAANVLIGRYNTRPVVASPLSNVTVLVDPGHGSFDSGATANGAVEKELNLEVAKMLQQYIEAGGGIVYLTRAEDVSTALPESERNISQKLSDLKMRKADIEKFAADVFISIHMNKFAQEKYKGAQVFYDEDSEENKKLAESVQQALKDVLGDGNKRTAKAIGNSIFVLKDNEIPSVLVECGFLSNKDEAMLLQKEEYRSKIAWGIYLGLVRFFE